MAPFILFICQIQNINIFMLKMNKKGASLGFNEIKNKKVTSSVLGEIKNKNLPAHLFFQKSGSRNTGLFFQAENFKHLSSLPKWHRQSMQIQIRLLMKKQTDQGLPCLLFCKALICGFQLLQPTFYL